MFIRDGLNDSAAVAAADVGVAFSHGSQVTLSSPSFVLLQKRAPLEGIEELLRLSRKVHRRMRVVPGLAIWEKTVANYAP